MKIDTITKNLLSLAISALLFCGNVAAQDNKLVFEEVMVTAEKRSESLQDISQAVTALSDSDIEDKKY